MRALRAALAAAAIGACVGTQPQDLIGTLRATAAAYYHNAAHVAAVTGPDTTMDYYDRLISDANLLDNPATRAASLRSASLLDLSLATQLLDGSYQKLASIRGLGETLVRSSKDATLQPVAVYVPTHYSPAQPAALMVFLHGNQQAESHLLAPQYLQDIAEQTDTIVVAPYGRGAYDFAGAESDVYDAFEAATRAFTIDSRRHYLAGYSMGGFSVFRLAPLHPSDWTALMSVAGSLLASRGSELLTAMPENVRYYILTGKRDDNVPTLWPTSTAIFLREAGRAVAFYSQADGTHSMTTLQPIVVQAWSDMVRGVVRSPSGLTGPPNLPEATQSAGPAPTLSRAVQNADPSEERRRGRGRSANGTSTGP